MQTRLHEEGVARRICVEAHAPASSQELWFHVASGQWRVATAAGSRCQVQKVTHPTQLEQRVQFRREPHFERNPYADGKSQDVDEHGHQPRISPPDVDKVQDHPSAPGLDELAAEVTQPLKILIVAARGLEPQDPGAQDLLAVARVAGFAALAGPVAGRFSPEQIPT